MPKGKSKSKLSLSERRIQAFTLFGRGYTNTDVARELRVDPKTAAGYRKLYEEQVANAAQDQPDLLRDVLGNTMRMLGEYDDVRRLAWMQLGRKKQTIDVVCDHCGEVSEWVYQVPPTDASIVQFLNTIAKAAEGRSKLLGLLGVKHEVFIEIQNVNIVQNRIMGWLGEHLEGTQREALADFIETELAEYVRSDESHPTPVLDAASVAALLPGSEPIPATARVA